MHRNCFFKIAHKIGNATRKSDGRRKMWRYLCCVGRRLNATPREFTREGNLGRWAGWACAVNECNEDISPIHPSSGSIEAMFPVPWFVVALYLAAYTIVGMTIGAIMGWAVSLLAKGVQRKVLADAFLGAFGYLAAWHASIFMPWPRNTITYRLEGGTQVSSTMNRYQHPGRVAIITAIILPLLYELYRRRGRAQGRG